MLIQIKVTNHDGTPLGNEERDVVIRHGYSRQDEVYNEKTYRLDKNGVLKLEYSTPVNVTNTTALRIEVIMLGRVITSLLTPSPNLKSDISIGVSTLSASFFFSTFFFFFIIRFFS